MSKDQERIKAWQDLAELTEKVSTPPTQDQLEGLDIGVSMLLNEEVRNWTTNFSLLKTLAPEGSHWFIANRNGEGLPYAMVDIVDLNQQPYAFQGEAANEELCLLAAICRARARCIQAGRMM